MSYKPPFRYDEFSQFIMCDNGRHMAAQIPYVDPDPDSVLLIRGWGSLIGTGGLNLSEYEAMRIQNAFGERVAQLLNEHGVGDEVKKLLQQSKQRK